MTTKTVQTMIGVCLLSLLGSAQTVIYQQSFESGVKPPEFTPWHYNQSFAGMWGFQPAIDGKYSMAIQEDVTGFDIGTFCALPQALNTLTVTFSFRCPVFPEEYGLEVVDLYDAAGDEVADVYLSPEGQLYLTIGGSFGTISKPIPLNKKVTIKLQFSDVNLPGNASLTWSQPIGVFGGEVNGNYRIDGQYGTAVTQILFGPVESPIVFIYDDLLVTSP